MGEEVNFLPADKHESFRWIDSINFGVHSRACPKYKKQIHNIFVIEKQLKENAKDEVHFLPADKRQMFLQIYIIILGVSGKAYPNYPK